MPRGILGGIVNLNGPARDMSQAILELMGEDWVVDQILSERTITEIVAEVGSTVPSFIRWQDAAPGRLDRVNAARRQCAQLWEERAETVLRTAKNSFELTKARDLAHHYRWRASKINPRQYGDKVQQEITGAGGQPLMPTQIVIEAPDK